MKFEKEDIETIGKFVTLVVTKFFFDDEPIPERKNDDTKIEKPAAPKPLHEKKKKK